MIVSRLLLVCALVSFLPLSLSQSSQLPPLECPTNSTATANNGIISFAPLPEGEPLRTTAEYNAGGLALWYNLASGIIDAARPGGLPYDSINIVLAPVYASVFGFTANASAPNPTEVVQPLVSYFAGVIALTVIGGLIALCLPVCGCCFCCCRLCGNCGGKLKQKDTKYNDCLTWTFTILLILFTCGLGIGVIFSFFSNQQVFNSLRNFQSTANNALLDADTFVNTTVDEINFLLCQFNDTVDAGIGEVQTGVDSALATVDMFAGGVNNVVNNVVSLSQNINSTLGALQTIQDDVDNLRTVTLAELQGSLTAIADQLNMLQTNCSGLTIPTLTCPDFNSDTFRSAVNINLTQVPDVSQEIQNVQNVLQGVNLADLARQGNETFNNLTMNLRSQVSTAIDEIRSNSSQLSTSIDTIRNQINPILSQLTSATVLDTGRNAVETAFNFLSPYDTARYALGIVICLLAAVVVIVIFIGVLCGVIGFRRNREPDERTAISNCGGITLLFAVALAFIFGFLLLILSALTFFAGGIVQKTCQSIAPPQIELLTETLDNLDNSRGEYLLGRLIFRNGSVPITISGILNNCSNNATVFQALDLNRLVNLQDISNTVKNQIPNLQGELGSLTNGFTFDINSLLPDDLRMRLRNFSDSGVANINFTAFENQISRNLLNIDLEQQVVQLTNLSDTAISLMTSITPADDNTTLMGISSSALNIIISIQGVNSTLASVMQQVDMLSTSVNQLSDTADSFANASDDVINSADNLVEQVNGPLGIQKINMTLITTYDRVLDFVNSYLSHVLGSIETKVGKCDAIPIIYTGAYNSLCRFALDGLNGFWLALGWCGIFFLPVIIFAILAQQYYRKMKVDVEDFAHEDSFPLKTY